MPTRWYENHLFSKCSYVIIIILVIWDYNPSNTLLVGSTRHNSKNMGHNYSSFRSSPALRPSYSMSVSPNFVTCLTSRTVATADCTRQLVLGCGTTTPHRFMSMFDVIRPVRCAWNGCDEKSLFKTRDICNKPYKSLRAGSVQKLRTNNRRISTCMEGEEELRRVDEVIYSLRKMFRCKEPLKQNFATFGRFSAVIL